MAQIFLCANHNKYLFLCWSSAHKHGPMCCLVPSRSSHDTQQIHTLRNSLCTTIHTLAGPSSQSDIVASGSAVNTSVVFSPDQPGFTVSIALNLTDDQDALEAIESYQLMLIIPQTTRGVVLSDPTTTVINILDDDGM